MIMAGRCRALLSILLQVAVLAGAAHQAALRHRFLRGDAQRDAGRVETALTGAYPFYHSTKELASEVRRLAQGCRGAMTVVTASHGSLSLDAAYLSKPTNHTGKTRFSMITGEHARELIGPETALHFLKMLCGEVAADGIDVDKILDHTEFQVIFNANPVSRQSVEEGDFCIRANPNGVDLNRNWDEMFLQGDGGVAPFSEPETIISRRLLSSYMPDIFMSIHSGTLGLYMPWAYSKDEADPSRNKDNMMSVLQNLDESYCQCPYGAAAKNVGYNCPGTSLDWVYDHLNASYSFAFEIWVEPSVADSVRMHWKSWHDAAAMLGISSHSLSHEHFRDFFQRHPSDFVHHNGSVLLEPGVGSVDVETAQKDMCLTYYNPLTATDFYATLQNWGLAYLRTASFVGANHAAAS